MIWKGCQLSLGSRHVRTAPRSHISKASTSYLVVVLAHTREASLGWILAVCDRFVFSRGVHRCIDGISRVRRRLRAFLFQSVHIVARFR